MVQIHLEVLSDTCADSSVEERLSYIQDVGSSILSRCIGSIGQVVSRLSFKEVMRGFDSHIEYSIRTIKTARKSVHSRR